MTDQDGGRPPRDDAERIVRLTSIVAIDVVGFSTMSERDQRRAAANIEALRTRIEAVAKRNEGRIFNTAGDGFMLEFVSAGAALAAINELLDSRPKREPAIRVGAHVGDVVVTINNDLLGHGVNIAARLQSLAAPNTALVSGEFRSMARNSPSAVFQSKGLQPLENIDQRVATFAIVPRRQRTQRLLKRGMLGAAAAAVLALGVVYGGPSLLRYVDGLNLFTRSQAGDASADGSGSPQAQPDQPAQVAAPAPPVHQPGETIRDCDSCPEMIVVPGGTFSMGSPASEYGRFAYEGPQREVTIGSFAVGAYEITFAEWDACLAGDGCGGFSPIDRAWGRGRRPVIGISWNDAQAYVQWLNRRVGANVYRLLTEAEWEYAARGGTTTRYAFGNNLTRGQAVFGGARSEPAGSYPANAFGLYDMHGNANEWVEDCYTPSYAEAPTDGRAVETQNCSQRAYRGGSYRDNVAALRSANRRRAAAGLRDSSIGFRVARSL